MKSKVNKEFRNRPTEFFKNSSFEFLENERSRTVVERGIVQKVTGGAESAVNKKVDKELESAKTLEFFKNTSTNFLENERYHTIAERGIVDNYIEKYESQKQLNATQIEEAHKQSAASETHQKHVFSAGGLKRYITTCYFQPKQIPVLYSETMILNIGSSKKKFFESVYHVNKLIPYKWSESMYTTIQGNDVPTLQKSEITIPIEESYHYISLEPQQRMI